MKIRNLLILTLFLSLPFSMKATTLRTIPDTCAKPAGRLLVNYNGRICPLQTLARDFTVALYGDCHYLDYTAEQVLFGWMLFYDDWYRHSILTSKDRAEQLEQLRIITTLHDGHLLHLFPAGDSAGVIRWFARADSLPTQLPTQERLFIRESEPYLRHLIENQDFQTLSSTLYQIRNYQLKRTQGEIPSRQKIQCELTYNRLSPTTPVPIAILGFGILFFLALLFHIIKNRQCWTGFKVFGSIILFINALYLLLLFVLQWYVTEQIPLNNSYDTLMFIALWSDLIALFLVRRSNRLIPFGLLIAGFSMLAALVVQKGHTIALRSPALDSPLLGIHVSITMLSYTLFAFITFNALAALLSKRIPRGQHSELSQRLKQESQKLLYPALSLLAAGIVVGSIWAKKAWGSYWSWDPKETWALITTLLYGVLVGIGRKKDWDAHPDRYHILAIVCFVSVLFTYFGVSYLLGGLHSYAK